MAIAPSGQELEPSVFRPQTYLECGNALSRTDAGESTGALEKTWTFFQLQDRRSATKTSRPCWTACSSICKPGEIPGPGRAQRLAAKILALAILGLLNLKGGKAQRIYPLEWARTADAQRKRMAQTSRQRNCLCAAKPNVFPESGTQTENAAGRSMEGAWARRRVHIGRSSFSFSAGR